jgi:hypothetical protein
VCVSVCARVCVRMCEGVCVRACRTEMGTYVVLCLVRSIMSWTRACARKMTRSLDIVNIIYIAGGVCVRGKDTFFDLQI